MIRWKKIVADVVQVRGRIFIMIFALALGEFSLAAISSTYFILDREIDRSYLTGNPPAAVLEVATLNESLIATLRQHSGIQWTEAGGTIWGRVEVRAGEWLPLILFVKSDFESQRIGIQRLDSGRWPIAVDEIAIERTAAPVANVGLQSHLAVQFSAGAPRTLTVTGLAHDSGLAPASQQQVVYAYTTSAVAATFLDSQPLQKLLLELAPSLKTPEDVEKAVVSVAEELNKSGHPVGEIQLPPRHHPHWTAMKRLVRLLIVFSLMSLLLGAILTATLTSTLLAPQVRQIAIMKAIGARSFQIMQMYLGLITAIGCAAVILGLPFGLYVGKALAVFVGHNQNLDFSNVSIPTWALCLQVIVALVVPLILCLVPISIATRKTVRSALDSNGIAAYSPPGIVTRALLPLSGVPSRLLVVRNVMRRKGRLLLTLLLLGAAGALFISSLDMLAAWNSTIRQAGLDRHYDVEITFAKPQPISSTMSRLQTIPAVKFAEPFDQQSVVLKRKDGLNISQSFSDGGHGSLQLNAVPDSSRFLSPTVISGTWLSALEPASAVINTQLFAALPGLRVDDIVHLNVDGRVLSVRIGGIVREHLTNATIYVRSEVYRALLQRRGLTTGFRIQLKSGEQDNLLQATSTIEKALEADGIRILYSSNRAQIGRELSGHLFILIFILISMSILMAGVGVLGLSSALLTNVLERTREFGVMRAIGASRKALTRMVLCESMGIAVISVVLGVLLSIPLTLVTASVVGGDITTPAQSVLASMYAIPTWLVLICILSIISSEYPARAAASLTIHSALLYE